MSCSCKNYFKSTEKLFEVTVCIILGLLLALIPHIPIIGLNQRPIPYQVSKAGDVILNSGIDNDLLPETIPAMLSFIVAGLIPLIIQIVISLYLGESDDTHLTICVYFLANGITKFLTDFVKRYCGYLRPNFYSLCEFDKDSLSCKGSSHDIKESRVSFMSGHSSFSFCCTTILTLYLLRLFGVNGLFYTKNGNDSSSTSNIETRGDLEQQRNNSTLTLKEKSRPAIHRMLSIICLLPMFVAFFFAASRVHDNFHHPADVVSGSVLGCAIAKFVYDTWFYPPPVRRN